VSDDQGKKLFYAKAGGEKTRVIEVIKKGGMQVKGNREQGTGNGDLFARGFKPRLKTTTLKVGACDP
jgi:hypothetical protein